MSARSVALPARSHQLSAQQVNALVLGWQQDRDKAALDRLVVEFLPLVRRLVRRYGQSSIPNEDLFQVGSLGLVKAINRFDVSRGPRLASFAIPTILGELRRHFRDSGWAIHVGRGAQERALAVRDGQERLMSDTGRKPTAGQLAEYLEMTLEEVLDGLQALGAYETSSLDAPRDEGDGSTLVETLGCDDPNFERAEAVAVARVGLRSLDDRQRLVLRLRFFEELSQSEIAARLGVSQMQVSRILSKCLRDIQTTVDQDGALGAV